MLHTHGLMHPVNPGPRPHGPQRTPSSATLDALRKNLASTIQARTLSSSSPMSCPARCCCEICLREFSSPHPNPKVLLNTPDATLPRKGGNTSRAADCYYCARYIAEKFPQELAWPWFGGGVILSCPKASGQTVFWHDIVICLRSVAMLRRTRTHGNGTPSSRRSVAPLYRATPTG